MFSRRSFLKQLGAGVVAAGLIGVQGFAKSTRRPNIIYINVDDMGWTDLGYMGSDYYQTPNIDRLAGQGVVFTNAYAPAANCAPSRACCMSGQYTPRHGIYTVDTSERGKAKDRKLIPITNNTTLAADNITLAEALKTGGYVTCHVGKWHLNDDARTQGFDVNIGGNHVGHPKSYFSPYKNPDLTDGPVGEHLTDRLTTDAISFIKQHKTQPFFLYLAFYAVHMPLQGKPELVKKYKSKTSTAAHNNPTYAAMVETTDTNVGRLVKALEDLKLTDDTMILFCSDNGGLYKVTKQWPLRAGKGAYYEGGIREPMFVKWPGVVEPGRRCEVPVCGIDFYPTFLEAAGLSQPVGKVLDGLSLMPLLTNLGTLKKRPLFWHFPIYLQGGNSETQDLIFRTRPGSAIRYGHWKLIEYFENGDLELYNLKDDLGEKNNLAKKRPDKVKELLGMLKAWRKKTNAPVPTQLNPKYKG